MKKNLGTFQAILREKNVLEIGRIFFYWSCDIFHFLGCIAMVKSTISQILKIRFIFSFFSKDNASLRIIESELLFLRGVRGGVVGWLQIVI